MQSPLPEVLIVAENGQSGGIGRYCVDLASALGAPARLVCLCSTACDGRAGCWLSQQCAERGMSLVQVAMPAQGWRAGYAGLVSTWRQSGRPALHVNGRRGNSIALAARVAVPGLRYVTTAHGVLGLHVRRNALYRLVDLASCRGATAVIAVSEDTRRRLLRLGSPRRRTIRISNGLSERVLVEFGRIADRRAATEPVPVTRVGFLGRLSPEKGTSALVEIARRLAALGQPVHVAIAGDGPDQGLVLSELETLLDRGFVRYEGVADPHRFLAEIDILVMPSRNEGLPYVLLEAMAAGCAVVAYKVGGIPEVIRNGSTGVLVTPGDVDALAAAVVRLCNDPALVAALGRAASSVVQGRFRLEQRLPAIARMYAATRSRRLAAASVRPAGRP